MKKIMNIMKIKPYDEIEVLNFLRYVMKNLV